MKKRYRKCQTWPRCGCIEQGYVNDREPNNCGDSPSRRVAVRQVRGSNGEFYEYRGIMWNNYPPTDRRIIYREGGR